MFSTKPRLYRRGFVRYNARMLQWLKKHFIPHEGNEHRPHFLREESMRRIVVLVVALELIAFILPSLVNLNLSGGMAAVLPAVLGQLTNENRQAVNLPVLAVNPLLTLAAEMKAQDMAEKSYFAHTSPEGRTPWYWLEQAGYQYQYAGENLAVNFRDSEDVTRAWLQSPTHRANIVKGNYTEMGTGVAGGVYQGRNTVFVAQVYANPRPAPAPRAPASIPAPATEVATVAPQVLGSEVSPVELELKPEPETRVIAEKPAPWQKAFASPRRATNFIMFAVFGIIAVALALYVVFKRREHHRDLLGNGLALLAIIGALFVANHYLSYGQMQVLESYDYSVEETL